jgi:hypothetical protein
MTGEEQFKELYRRYIHREGAEELLEWMERETDFFTAPASTKHHLAYPGGLVEHSVNVRRSDSGGRYVVAKTGMLVAGVVFPVQAVNEGFCDKLEELASMTRRELDKHLAAPPVTEEEDEGQENVFGGGDGET